MLDTAASLFWEKGYTATTTREIAAAVGIQQASLYYHVASKEDLLYKLGVASLEQIRKDVRAAVNQAGDPLDRLRVFIHAHLITLLSQQIRHVTVVTHLHRLSAPHRAEVLELRQQYSVFVRGLIEDGQKAGAIRNDIPARYLYLALLNLLNWAVFWFRRDESSSVGHAADVFEKLFLEGTILPSGRARLNPPDFAPRAPVQSVPLAKTSSSTQERILEHAARLFASQGYSATSTREIAAALGIRKASLYSHVENKEDLLFEICKRAFERILNNAEAALSDASDPLERISRLIQTQVQTILSNLDQHSAAISELHLLSPARRELVVEIQRRYEDLIRVTLRDAQTSGALRGDIPAEYLCVGLLGFVNRVTVWYRSSGPLTPEQLGSLLCNLFLTGAASDRVG